MINDGVPNTSNAQYIWRSGSKHCSIFLPHDGVFKVQLFECPGAGSVISGLSLNRLRHKYQRNLNDENQGLISDTLQLTLSSLISKLQQNPAKKPGTSNNARNNVSLLPMDNVNNKILKKLLPLKDFESLYALEGHVQREEFRNNMIHHLRLKGGDSLGDTVRRMLAYVMTDDLAQKFSWIGFKKKENFSETCLPDIIFEAIRCQSSYENASDTEIAKPLRSWLTHAKYRYEERLRKDSLQNYRARTSVETILPDVD